MLQYLLEEILYIFASKRIKKEIDTSRTIAKTILEDLESLPAWEWKWDYSCQYNAFTHKSLNYNLTINEGFTIFFHHGMLSVFVNGENILTKSDQKKIFKVWKADQKSAKQFDTQKKKDEAVEKFFTVKEQ